MSDNHESNAFLTSMSKISDLNERLYVWQPLIDQVINTDSSQANPAVHAYQANYVLHKITTPSSTHVSFKDVGFDVKLFLTLFKSEYQKLKICPKQASQYMSVLSQAGYFSQKDQEEIQKALSKLEPVLPRTLSAISVFSKNDNTNDKSIASSPSAAA